MHPLFNVEISVQAEEAVSFEVLSNMYPTWPMAFLWSVVLLAPSVVSGTACTQDVVETKTNFFDPWEQPSTRYFDFTVTWAQNAPDGVKRNMFMVNGQFPGPKMELVQGDSVVVKLRNSSPFNATIHYHGAYLSPVSQRNRGSFC